MQSFSPVSVFDFDFSFLCFSFCCHIKSLLKRAILTEINRFADFLGASGEFSEVGQI